jgi:RNA recognition motif-containing protein
MIQMTERDLEDAFGKYGKVVEARIATDRDTRRPKGFAFVTMEDAADAKAAVEGLVDFELDGRVMTVQFSHGEGGARKARSDVCYDWQKGRCNRGSSCRFSHSEDGSGGGDRGGDRGGRDNDRDRDYRRDDRGGRDRDYGRRDDRDRGGRDRSRDRDRDYGRDRDRGGRDRSRDRDYDRDRR